MSDDNQKLPDVILNDTTKDYIDIDLAKAPKEVQAAVKVLNEIDIPNSHLRVSQNQDGLYVLDRTRVAYTDAPNSENSVVLNADTPNEIELKHRSGNFISAEISFDPKSGEIDFHVEHDGSYADTLKDGANAGISELIGKDKITNRTGGLDGVPSIQQEWTRAAVQTMEFKYAAELGLATPIERPEVAAKEVGTAPLATDGTPVKLSTLNLTPGMTP